MTARPFRSLIVMAWLLKVSRFSEKWKVGDPLALDTREMNQVEG